MNNEAAFAVIVEQAKSALAKADKASEKEAVKKAA